MAFPVASSYSAASGGTIYGGRTAVSIPSWVPPSGFFADVPMLNLPTDVTPTIYTGNSSAMAGPFDIWGGGAWLRDYSNLGALVYYSGGHETSSSQINIQLTLVCDFSTLLWAAKNVPVTAHPQSDFNGAQDGYATDGTAYTAHTYLGIQEMPAAWGGPSKGSLVSFFFAGSTFSNRVNLFDVSQATNGHSKMTTNQAASPTPTRISFVSGGGFSTGSYPLTAQDEARQGWWAMSEGANSDYALFIDKTGTITQIPALSGSGQYSALVLCPSLGAAGLLINVLGGYDAASAPGQGQNPNTGKTIVIRDLATGVVTSSLVLGTQPALRDGFNTPTTKNFYAPRQLGLQWVDELGCMVGLDDTSVGPVTVYKLTPPSTNPQTNQWTWSAVSLSHWDAGDPAGQSTLQATTNTTHSKFRWIPTLHAFVYGSAKNRKPQIIKL